MATFKEQALATWTPPKPIQPQERIAWLKERLEDPKNERQKVNILALIRMYETGELGPLYPGTDVWVCDGKICEDPIATGRWPFGNSPVWAEKISTQMMQQSQVQAPSQ